MFSEYEQINIKNNTYRQHKQTLLTSRDCGRELILPAAAKMGTTATLVADITPLIYNMWWLAYVVDEIFVLKSQRPGFDPHLCSCDLLSRQSSFSFPS